MDNPVPKGLSVPDVTGKGGDSDGPYTVNTENWYKSFPYEFAYWDSEASKVPTESFYLPIAPNNLQITTHYATNVITTLYGVVEEHSEVRYYDIIISGNTGIAPKYVNAFKTAMGKDSNPITNKIDPNSRKSGGRDYFRALSGILGGLSGVAGAVLGQVSGILNTFTTQETGISKNQSGYLAFHNFYKFLLRYKSETSQTSKQSSSSTSTGLAGGASKTKTERSHHPLSFLNYKDGVKYDVIPLSFTMTKSAENPMLYNYTIRMRGFNLRAIDAKVESEDLAQRLGLGSLGGNFYQKATSVVGRVSTLRSGFKGI